MIYVNISVPPIFCYFYIKKINKYEFSSTDAYQLDEPRTTGK